MMAPPPYGGSVLSFPPAESRAPRVPPVDEHLVKPEVTRDEIIRGRKIVAQPALAPHADAHTRLDMLVGTHIRPGYIASTDLLTRVTETSNFATDTCVRKEGNDPVTGRRWLEEVAFEIANTQTDREVRAKAEELIARGVRRVFCIFTKKEEIGEWSPAHADFVLLPKDGAISDPCFVRPLSIRALLDRIAAENEVVRALEAQGNPEIARVRQEGVEQGLREALLRMMTARFGDIPSAARGRVESAKAPELEGWISRVFAAAALDEVFVEGSS